jgi:prepilin-type N-terminal cleavage/methylation domain-containing protein
VNKKGFTLIEIVLALIIAFIASAYVIKTLFAQDFKEELVKLQDNVQFIIEEGIASPTGYASGGGGDCSTTLNYANLTTNRLFGCLRQGDSWRDLELTTSTPQYITNFDSGFMNSYGGFATDVNLINMGCGIEVMGEDLTAPNGVATNHFYVLVNCSRIAPSQADDQDETDKRRLSQIEDAIEFVFVRKLEYMYVNHNRQANVLGGTGSGSDSDGIIWGEFRH